ncbi:hypothetical protein [uncultured Clostridium sp.]|uniref:hypothetical protein n=1 Tax=uncultured Clostridium sp. TaxID=59620 RepID=UPI00262FB7C1|nr:hypothetical protein [uncultured Clostridium sp.]
MNIDQLVFDKNICKKYMKSLNMSEEEFKEIIRGIIEFSKAVKTAMNKLMDYSRDLYNRIFDIIEKRNMKRKIGYPAYKTRYRTVKFFNKKIYYNCRNTC